MANFYYKTFAIVQVNGIIMYSHAKPIILYSFLELSAGHHLCTVTCRFWLMLTAQN